MDYDTVKLTSHVTPSGANDLCGMMMHIFKNINLRLGFAVLILSIIMYSDFVTEGLLVPLDAAVDGSPTTYGFFILHLLMALAVVVLDLLMKEGL